MADSKAKQQVETADIVVDATDAEAAVLEAEEVEASEATSSEVVLTPADIEAVDDADASAAADEPESDDEEGEEDEESEDSLTYSNGVIEKIVAMATREVPHILGMKGNLLHSLQEQFGAENLTKGVTVEVTDDNRVIVNISVIIEYGSYAPAIFEDVKERVTDRLASMTGLEVAGVNLRIEDVVTRDEYDASKKHSSDSHKAASAESEPEDAAE